MLIGYARVSTIEQNNELQEEALRNAGCSKIFTDKISGAVNERPGLSKVKEFIRNGDTLVIWRLDRLGRSLRDLIEWMTYFEIQGIAVKSVQERLDTSTASGRLIFHIFGALAEFERNLIKERTNAGLSAARSRGRFGGRPLLLNEDKRALVVKLYNEKRMSVKKICEMLGISKPTLYSYLRASKSKS